MARPRASLAGSRARIDQACSLLRPGRSSVKPDPSGCDCYHPNCNSFFKYTHCFPNHWRMMKGRKLAEHPAFRLVIARQRMAHQHKPVAASAGRLWGCEVRQEIAATPGARVSSTKPRPHQDCDKLDKPCRRHRRETPVYRIKIMRVHSANTVPHLSSPKTRRCFPPTMARTIAMLRPLCFAKWDKIFYFSGQQWPHGRSARLGASRHQGRNSSGLQPVRSASCGRYQLHAVWSGGRRYFR